MSTVVKHFRYIVSCKVPVLQELYVIFHMYYWYHGTMVPRVPDTFSCPSKSSRIFIKSFLFLFISSYYGRSSVKVWYHWYQNQNQSGYHWYQTIPGTPISLFCSTSCSFFSPRIITYNSCRK